MQRTQRKTAVVAGGSAGIGKAVGQKLALAGFNVVLLARNKKRVELAATELRNEGVDTLGLSCDVSDHRAVERAAKKAADRFGTIDVWVNSAMLTVFGPFEEMDDTEFRQVMDTTFMGQVNGTRAALSHMKPHGRGAIVNIGSGLSYRSVPLQSAYCAAKHAINGFTSSVRSELIHDGYGEAISISLVQLPAVNTPQFDWARANMEEAPRPAASVYQPEVAADAVMQAIDTGARELLVGRSVLGLVFGQMVAPNYFDHKMAQAGWTGQQEEQAGESGERNGNLMEPVSGPYGAHGSFSAEAADSGLIVDADRARYGLFGGLAALGLGVAFLAGAMIADNTRRDKRRRLT